MMSIKLKNMADDIFSWLTKPATNPDYPGQTFSMDFFELDWSDIRDICDTKTGSEMDCFRLDMLTDMVMSRINKHLDHKDKSK